MASYIDFKYPSGGFGLNRTPQLPSSFGPPNMASMFQSGISGLADPLVAAMKEASARAETARSAADGMKTLEKLYANPAADTATTSSTTASAAPRPRPVDPSTAGSPAGDDAGTTMGGGPAGRANPEVRDTFLGTVKQGGLTNPYGLAAVAATGHAESGWSSGNVNRTWDDLGKPSGGLMSWRADRLRNMQASIQGAEDPVRAQAEFFLKEDPRLIERLNAARSPEEANALMAQAWRYKGHEGGAQFKAREALTRRYAAQLGEPAPAPAAAPTAVAAAPQAPTPQEQAAARLGTPAPPPPPAPQASFAAPVAPAPTPQAAAAVTAPQGPQQAPQQGPTPQEQQQAAQAQVIQSAEQGDQATAARLAAERDVGRTRVASLDPSIGPPRAVPTTREAGPPDAPAISPIPMVAPQALPPTPAPAASAPTAPAGPTVPPVAPAGVPSEAPAPTVDRAAVLATHDRAIADALARGDRGRADQLSAMRPQIARAVEPDPAPRPAPVTPQPAPISQQPAPPAPVRVAQATGLPGAISGQQRGGIDRATAEFLLRNARTPEEVSKVVAAVAASMQPPEQKGNRFDLKHDTNGNWYRVDQLTGAVTAVPPPGGPGTGAPNKEIREAERSLHNDFESTQTVKEYRQLEQGVQGLKAAFSEGNATADLVSIIQLFKTIDPTSTVSATEVANVKNASGVPEVLRALWNRGIGEGGQFSPQLRGEIFNTAQRIQQQRLGQVEQQAKSYRNRAKAYGLEPERVVTIEPFKFDRVKPDTFPDYKRAETKEAPARIAPGSSRENPLDVPDEPTAERMPAGTWFRLPPKTPGGRPRIGVVE